MNWELIFWNALYAGINASTAAYCMVSTGLNVHVGYTGLLNFGQAGFAALGAYAFAIPIVNYDWPWYWSLLLVFVASILLALLLGIPTLRLRADYLAIVTIAAAEIIRYVLASTRFTWLTGGTDGRQGWTSLFQDLNPWPNDAHYELGAQVLSGYQVFMMVVGWSLALLLAFVVWLLMRSPWGRVLKSIREDEDAARSLGKNVFSYKMQSLVLGGVIGSLGGFVFALDRAAVQPDTYGTEFTFFAYTIVILGGAARVFGPVVGSMIFWVLLVFIDSSLSEASNNKVFPEWFMTTSQAGSVRYILVGLGLILLLIYRPQGIFGDKREVMLDGR
jgi:neutral amino acid transport system permease protein